MENNNEINLKELRAKMYAASAHAYSAFAHFFTLEINEAKEYVEKAKTGFDEIHAILKNLSDRQEQKKENEQKVADVNDILNGECDYWKEAVEFGKSLVVENIEERFAKYCKERNFNHNEILLFRKMLAEAIEFNFTIATLKHLI